MVDAFFLERDGSRAGDRQERSAPAPGARLFPALTWEHDTYFWEKKIQNEPISLMHCKFQGRIMLGSCAGVVAVVVELQSLGDSGCLEMRNRASTGPRPTPGVPGQGQHPSSSWLPTKARGVRALPHCSGEAHE